MAERGDGWAGIAVHELANGRRQSLALIDIAAGALCPLHHHRVIEEVFHVLDGEAVVDVEDTRVTLSPSQSVVVPVGAWHRVGATDAGPVRLIVSCAPPHSDDDTFYE